MRHHGDMANIYNPSFPIIRRGDTVVYTDGQGVEHTDTVARVNLIPGYYDPSVVSRWYVLTDLKLGVHESAVKRVAA